MRHILKMAIAAAAFAASAPAFSAATVTPANDPCHSTFVKGAIACQGYYGTNLLTGTTGSATTSAELAYIKLLLTGTPSTTDTTPTTNTSAYTGNYPGIKYGTVLGAIEGLPGLSGPATLDFGTLNLSGLTVLGAHFGNNIDSSYNNVTAFWLVDAGSTITHKLTLTDGQGSSNAQIFSTGTPALPEPGTWAMMLLGFGGIGVAMRRSKRLIPNHLRIA